MKRYYECNKYNLFDSPKRTQMINELVKVGYNKDKLDAMCIDCVSNKYKAYKKSVAGLKALSLIADANSKKHSEASKYVSEQPVEKTLSQMQKCVDNKMTDTFGVEGYKMFLNKYF